MKKTSWYFMESVFGRGTCWTVSRQKNEAEFYLPEFKGLIDDPQTHSCLVEERRCQGMGCFDARRISASKFMQKHLFLLEKQTVEKVKHEGLGKAFFVIKQQVVLETKLKLEVTWALEKTFA